MVRRRQRERSLFEVLLPDGHKLWPDWLRKIDTLLDTNRVMLEKGRAHMSGDAQRTKIVDPVYIEPGVKLVNSTIGPNVSISAGTVVENSTVRDAVIGENAKISACDLSESLIGDEDVLDGVKGSVTVGDHSEVRARK